MHIPLGSDSNSFDQHENLFHSSATTDMLCRPLQNRASKQSCASTQPYVCPSCVHFNPLGPASVQYITSLPIKVQLDPSSMLLLSWDSRTRVQDKEGCQMTCQSCKRCHSYACQILCLSVVPAIKVSNVLFLLSSLPLVLQIMK